MKQIYPEWNLFTKQGTLTTVAEDYLNHIIINIIITIINVIYYCYWLLLSH